jgi:hypothetical protein
MKLSKKNRNLARIGVAFLLIIVLIVVVDVVWIQPATSSSSKLKSSSVSLSITLTYANAPPKTFTSSLAILPLQKPSSLSVIPFTPITIMDLSKGAAVTSYNVNLDLIPVYALASGASIQSWSFTGAATVQIVSSSGGTPLYNSGSVALSAPPTSNGVTSLVASGQSEIMFSSTGQFSQPPFSTAAFTNGGVYNYVFTLQSGAVFSITDSLGNKATYTTTQAYTLTWQFEYVSTTISSLSVVWAGSSS